jgi:hypothetical protein
MEKQVKVVKVEHQVLQALQVQQDQRELQVKVN